MIQTEKQLEDFLFNGLYKCPEELESRGLLENTFGEFGNISCYVICKSYDGFYTQNFSPVHFITYSFDWITGVQFDFHQGHSSWYMKSDSDKSFRNRKKITPDLSKIFNGKKID